MLGAACQRLCASVTNLSTQQETRDARVPAQRFRQRLRAHVIDAELTTLAGDSALALSPLSDSGSGDDVDVADEELAPVPVPAAKRGQRGSQDVFVPPGTDNDMQDIHVAR